MTLIETGGAVMRTFGFCCVLVLGLTACGGISRGPVPLGLEDEVVVVGVNASSIRFWG